MAEPEEGRAERDRGVHVHRRAVLARRGRGDPTVEASTLKCVSHVMGACNCKNWIM